MVDVSAAAPFGADPPWVIIADPSEKSVLDECETFRRRGGVFAMLEGAELAAVDRLFAAFARELQFPSYFGRNWDALVDCLADLHPHVAGEHGLLVRVAGAQALLGAHHLGLLLEVICQATERSNSMVDADGISSDRSPRLLSFVFELEVTEWRRLQEVLAGRSLKITDRGAVLGVELPSDYWD